ncbi:MAG: ABC transporter substrate-binding protein [Phycisphaerae bacterium]
MFGTIELARRGVFSPLPDDVVADIPRAWRDNNNFWVGFAARARVLAYDAARFDADDVPQSWEELATRESLSDVAIANPQFGTTRGHIATLFAYWGPERATAFLQKLRDDNARITDGNSQAVMEVLAGGAALGMTDTDDVWVNQGKSETLSLVYPTISDSVLLSRQRTHPTEPIRRVIWIPNTVARVAGGPNDKAGASLLAFLASAEIEKALALSDSRNVPVRAELREELNIDTTTSGPPEPLQYEKIASGLEEAMKAAREILLK